MKPRNTKATWRGRAGCALLAALLLMVTAAAGAAEKKPVAKLEISGLGWFDNWEMRRALERLLGAERGETLRANAIEDAMFLLMSAVQDQGFLKPIIKVDISEAVGPRTSYTLDAAMAVAIPRETTAQAVKLSVEQGVRYYFKDLKIEGLHVLPEKMARSFFVGESALLIGKRLRVYTPARLARGLESVAAELRQRGYAEAEVRAGDLRVDDQSGEVSVVVTVNEGPRWRVSDLRVTETQGDVVDTPVAKKVIGQPWSDAVQQDAAAEIRRAYFAKGYPDVRVRMAHETTGVVDGQKDAVITAQVRSGEHVTLGDVRFEGAGDTHEAVLRRRVRTKAGEPLNMNELEQARYRISRLGVFDRVDLRMEPADGAVRSPVFALQPGRRVEVNLLAGYGSYEALRGGVEVRQYDLFGLAHQTRGLLVESMKSTRGEYSYTVPEIFGESIDGTAKLFGLQRDEVAFERQEYGGTLSLSSPMSWVGANATVGYTFQALRNRENELETKAVDDKQVIVASVNLGLTRDRRDNPLVPRKGYRWFTQMEAASRVLGGEAEYQRLEFGGSYHTSWGDGRWIHLGAAHGVVTTWGSRSDAALPVNKRFFPGGDGSIRGYQIGEAAPRGADGKFVGAKSYLTASVEFEQALARNWSAVVFGDALGAATQLRHYPFDEKLYAVGLGLRYRTLIGPIRAEYGRNLNPRLDDPSGTWLLSIGFPF